MSIREEFKNGDFELRQNFLGANRKVAINSYGQVFKIGETGHEGAEAGDFGVIESFEFDEETVEVKAHTTKGHGHIDFMFHPENV